MILFRRIILIVVIFIGCVALDQGSKLIVRQQVDVGVTYSWLHDTVRLTHAENSGAFLSLGDRLPENIRRVLFNTLALVISVTALSVAILMRDINRKQIIGLTLIAAGGFANWIDRITNDGHVTDFMNVGIGWLRTGIFNVADLALTAGVLLYIFMSSRAEQVSDSEK